MTILHTNDLHSHFENWPKIRRYLKMQQKALLSSNSSVLTFDLGDAMDRVHPLSEATDGQANVELLNQIGYDAVTIGNNEGLGNTKEQLERLYQHANFDVVLGNLLDQKNGQQPDFARQFKIITTNSGTRVGVLGLTAPFILTYPLEGWQPIDVFEAIPYLLDKIKGQYDVLILLSHLGITVDEKIAASFPEFNVIIGSHTHHLLEHGKRVGQSLLAAAGKYGQYIGKIDLELEDHKISAAQARVTVTEHLPSEPDDDAEIVGYLQQGEQLLAKQQIAKIPTALSVDFENDLSLVNSGLEALKESTNTDIAMLNTGLFLNGLDEGIVNRNQLHEMLPHAMHVMKVTLLGSDLIRLVREIEKNRNFLRRFPLKGMGFRGKIFGEIHYAGLEFKQQTKQVTSNGKPIDIFEQYTLATLDHYLFIPFFPTIEIAGKNELMYNKFFRDVFGNYLMKHFPI
ncbi:bifunctional metallophosphatase/5'-nucleotidase [Paucilactobacillus hokkaidonensis]|uniref:bifunctional metallophosphatase/5'-nucleotidase n=1 Tax=Paucilactobacillus hokkaidonensis TaxID=1193095 RepID=UPI0006D226FD|nr:bifunctional metallophosphatase/5'-nucleotidase [Paucilactobacillus hokkaidonensis]